MYIRMLIIVHLDERSSGVVDVIVYQIYCCSFDKVIIHKWIRIWLVEGIIEILYLPYYDGQEEDLFHLLKDSLFFFFYYLIFI